MKKVWLVLFIFTVAIVLPATAGDSAEIAPIAIEDSAESAIVTAGDSTEVAPVITPENSIKAAPVAVENLIKTELPATEAAEVAPITVETSVMPTAVESSAETTQATVESLVKTELPATEAAEFAPTEQDKDIAEIEPAEAPQDLAEITQNDASEVYDKPAINKESAPDWNTYMKKLDRQIKKNWNPPKANKSTLVIVQFKISKGGEIEDPEIIESSGNKDADSAAIEAIKMTSPFLALPEEYEEDFVSLNFKFGKHSNNTTAGQKNERSTYSSYYAPFYSPYLDKRGIPKNPNYVPVMNKNWEHWQLN